MGVRHVGLVCGLWVALFLAGDAEAGGPRWVAGTSYFSAGLAGRPVVWKGGVVNYYTDPGDLSATVTHVQADEMVAAAAQLWSGISTAAVTIARAGALAEDVSGANFFAGGGGLAMPADVASTATARPLGVIYDADGSVLDALEGEGASDPLSCNTNGVTARVDNLATDATIAHALLVVNGRCATDAAHVALLQYELLRGFGRVLGLDWSQANDQMFPAHITEEGLAGWPILHPLEKLCNSNGNACVPGTIAPRTDDIAALNRLYPVTAENLTANPGKIVTVTATISISGRLTFRTGQGMQGVNVVARPLIPGSDVADMRYPAAAVTGSLFRGSGANPILGKLDAEGVPLDRFGSTDASLEGWYDLSGIPLPPGATEADYELIFEAINPLYTGTESVGPYSVGQVKPSGTMPTVILRGLKAGAAVVRDETIGDSAGDGQSGADGTEENPATLPLTGQWMARVSGYGHASWLRWRMRGGRQATLEAQPLDEAGHLTEDKARLLVGVWNGDDSRGLLPDLGTPAPFNERQTGLTALPFATGADGEVRIAVADERGDGRPDYLYEGRVLYADSVTPARIGLSGGPIVIEGAGFRLGSLVTVGGKAAQVTGVSASEITAIAPAGNGGDVDVTVTDPVTHSWTTIQAGYDGLTYDASARDGIVLVAAPAASAEMGVPSAFTVRVVGGGGAAPVSGVVVSFAVTQGSAALGCGMAVCEALTGGDGLAAVMVIPQSTAPAMVTASLNTGGSLSTQFTGVKVSGMAAVSGPLYVASGAMFSWDPEAIVLKAGVPQAGRTVNWSVGATGGAVAGGASSVSDGHGLVSGVVTVGPLTVGQTATVNACLAGAVPGGSGCAGFIVSGVDASLVGLEGISGVTQVLGGLGVAEPIVLRVVDGAGHSVAGATVNFYETLRRWSGDCGAQGGCAQAPVLARRTSEAVSGVDGLVTLAPLTQSGVATRLEGLAVTGSGGTVQFEVDSLPD